MEVVVSIFGSAVAGTVRLLYDSLYSKINNTVKLRSGLYVLEEEMKSLMSLRNEVKDETESAEREGKAIRGHVIEWLREVDELELELRVNPIQADIVNNRKLSGCSLNCRKRYRVSREVAEILQEIQRLLKSRSFLTGSVVYPTTRPREVEHIPGPSIQGQTTSSKALTKTMNLLHDDGVKRIGIWGMGGIGKTTLVKNLNNELKTTSSTQPFGIVMWAIVSKNLDMKKVQKQIAERLN